MSLSRRIPTPLMVATIGGSNPFPIKPFFVAATFPHDTVIKASRRRRKKDKLCDGNHKRLGTYFCYPKSIERF